LGKVEEVTEGLNNMCTVVGDNISFVVWVAGYGGEKSHDNVRLRSTQSGSGCRVERYSWTAISGRPLWARLWPHNCSWMKFMDLKKYTFGVYGPK
jgi:hypothetical protein